MIGLRTSKILGIAVHQDSLSIAEVAVNGSTRRKVLHTSEFRFPAGVGLDKPAELGRAFARHLRSEGISTRDVAIGLPARWLVSRRKEVPPCTPEAAAASLRLQSEAEFASEQTSLALDYIGEASPTHPTSVLLVATSRSHLDPCATMLRSAGLHLRSATATGIALASASAPPEGRSVLVHLAGSAAELVIQNAGTPVLLGHATLAEGTNSAASLSNEIRRALASLPGQGQSKIVLCAAPAPDRLLLAALEHRLSMPVVPADLSDRIHANGANSAGFVPAISIGLEALDTGRPPIDFVHSRLAPPRPRTRRRPFVWAAVIAATLILASVLAWFDLRSKRNELALMKDHLASIADDVKAAQASADRLAYARTWHTGQSIFLNCLGQLTRLFPDEGSIYATSLSLRENLTGQLAGKATNKPQILSLLDKMKDDRHFAAPKLLDMRDAGPSGREVAFTISFEYRPVE